MKVNFTRNVDHWLGIPICFLLSLFHKMQKLFISRRFKEIKPKKIMFLELSEMGSAILAYSAMKKAKEMYPDAELYFWIFKQNQDSVHILNIIPKENIITMRCENLLLMFIDALRNLWRIWKEKIDVVIDMELFSRFSSILSYLSGAKIKVGFHRFSLEGLYRGSVHTHKVSYNPYLHISKNFISLVDSLEAGLDGTPLVKRPQQDNNYYLPKINISDQEKEDIGNKLRTMNSQLNRKSKIIIINFGFDDKISIRRWPVEHYLELIQRMLGKQDTFIVLIGVVSQDTTSFFLNMSVV